MCSYFIINIKILNHQKKTWCTVFHGQHKKYVLIGCQYSVKWRKYCTNKFESLNYFSSSKNNFIVGFPKYFQTSLMFATRNTSLCSYFFRKHFLTTGSLRVPMPMVAIASHHHHLPLCHCSWALICQQSVEPATSLSLSLIMIFRNISVNEYIQSVRHFVLD